MSVMFDYAIKEAILNDELGVNPYNENHVGAASLDLTLSSRFLIVEGHKSGGIIRMDRETHYETVMQSEFVLAPKQFVLASTQEYLRFPAHICGKISGRSSVGRMGAFVENAGFFDPGFEGAATLELFNANDYPIILIAGRRVCQMVFERSERPADNPYDGKYKGDLSTTGSRIYQDEDK